MENHWYTRTTAEGKIFYSKTSCETRKGSLWNLDPLTGLSKNWGKPLQSWVLYLVTSIQHSVVSPIKACKKKKTQCAQDFGGGIPKYSLGPSASLCLFSNSANDFEALTFLWTLSKCMCTGELGCFAKLSSPLSTALEMRQWVNWGSYLHPGPAQTYLSVVFGLQSK